MKQITSVQNPFIKQLIQLQDKAKVRKQLGLFVIEGQREIELAIKGGYEVETVLFCPELSGKAEKLKIQIAEHLKIEISKDVYQKIAYRDTTEGIIAIAKSSVFTVSLCYLIDPKLIVV